MTDLQAALGIHQLPQLDGWIARRAELVRPLRRALADLPLELPARPRARRAHARHLYTVLVEPRCAARPRRAARLADRANIGVGVHYRGVHLHPYYRDKYGLRPEQFPVATRISERVLSLPLGPKLSLEDQDDVIDALKVSTAARRGLDRSST